jgi:hypothetical protein
MTIDTTNAAAIQELAESLGIDLQDHADEAELNESYDDFLREVHVCDCCDCGHDYAKHLKDNDPTMYRCGFADWTDSEMRSDNLFYIGTEYLNELQMEELQDAIKDAIDELF